MNIRVHCDDCPRSYDPEGPSVFGDIFFCGECGNCEDHCDDPIEHEAVRTALLEGMDND